MGSLPWYCLWTEFPRHGKTLALCAKLRDDNAGMYIVRLLSHCAERALDGLIPADIVEGAAGWRKKRGVLLEALIAVGTLEPREGGVFYLHGWEERNGSRIRKALADNAKPRGNKPKSRCGPDAVPRGTGAGSAGVDVRSETEEEETEEAAARARAREEAAAAQSLPAAGGETVPPSSDPAPEPDCKHPALKPAPVAYSVTGGLRAGASPEAPSPRAGAAPTSARGAESPTLDPPRASTAPLAHLPTEADFWARYPHVLALRARLVAAGIELGLPRAAGGAATCGALDRSIDSLGLAAAEALVSADVRAAVAQGRTIGSLAAFGRALQQAAARGAPPPRDPPPAPEEADPGCAEWAATRERAKEKLRPDLYARWFAPLGHATANAGVLTVKAPDKYHQDFIVDNYGGWLAEMLTQAGHEGLRVEVTT